MKPVKIPNLPTGRVTTVIMDGRMPPGVKKKLSLLEVDVIETSAHPDVYPAVACHPDIMLHHIGEATIVYAPNTPRHILEKLKAAGFETVKGYARLGNKYPATIPYNIARVGNFAFHNTKYTDPVVKELLTGKGVEFIHTNQGYSKCLICIVDSNSILTSDADIHKKAVNAGLEVLLVAPDPAVVLKPFEMGFLGGAAGLLSDNLLAFTGDLVFHKNYTKILDFLSLKAVDVVMLNSGKLMDLGSILPIRQKGE